jgi:hypothetical protein
MFAIFLPSLTSSVVILGVGGWLWYARSGICAKIPDHEKRQKRERTLRLVSLIVLLWGALLFISSLLTS